MLRSLLILAVPFTSLLAYMPAPTAQPDLDFNGPVKLAAIPFAAQPEAKQVSELDELQASAEQGDLDAQTRVGIMYYWGQGAPKDYDQAKLWLRKAAVRGNRDAQAKLGAMCFLGQGGDKDVNEALLWFRRSADQGEPYAQGCMGVMYAVGEGVPQDLVEAYVWLVQANAGGDDDAADPLMQVRSHLTPAQIEEGNRRAAEAMNKRGAN